MDDACAVDGCDRPKSARGYCGTHYARWQRTGEVGSASIQAYGDHINPCEVEGCDRSRFAKRMCKPHYRRAKKGRDLTAPIRSIAPPNLYDACTVEGCETVPIARGMCDIHYRRWKKHGNPLRADINRENQHLSVEEAFLTLRGAPTDTGCVEWQGAVAATGYGALRRRGVTYAMHRYSYERSHGPIPEGAVVRHTCDNPPCINPDHLLIGTREQNAQDAVERQRHVAGTDHHAAKMDDEKVRELRRMRDGGMSYHGLADHFGLSFSQARAIARREAWKRVT